MIGGFPLLTRHVLDWAEDVGGSRRGITTHKLSERV
jgi:hypothetical protein